MSLVVNDRFRCLSRQSWRFVLRLVVDSIDGKMVFRLSLVRIEGN